MTVSGTRYSLALGATEIVIGSSTEVLTCESGLASYIWNGIGGGTGTSTGQAAATGESSLLSSSGSSSDVVTTGVYSTSGVSAASGPAGSQSTTATTSDAMNARAGHSGLTLVFALAICLVLYSST